MKEFIISSIQEYMEFIEKYKGNYYFRGQADAKWEIQPNIFRDHNKLKTECEELGEDFENNSLDIIKKILKIQHYGNGTRLCDVTINPMVALYFAIEDETKDDKSCGIFIFDKSSDISIDSLEMNILLILTVKKISTLDELQLEINHKLGVECEKELLKQIITKNRIIKYDINLSYSNNRALLQGGTGLYFGFGTEGESILRKGILNIDSLCMKIIIPSNKKIEIRNYLKKYGISKAVLYDNVNSSCGKLKYSIIERHVQSKPNFNKVILDVRVSDVVFVESEIYKIVSAVFRKTKGKYGSNARIFIYVYYDEEDIRASNWIARPSPINDFKEFQVNFNDNYHAKRMLYFNEEISINKMFSAIQPIVEKCNQKLIEIAEAHNNYLSVKISRSEYKILLQQVIKSLNELVYFDLQDISHGSGKFHPYYKSSNSFCINIIRIAEEQVNLINRDENDELLEWIYVINRELCDNSQKKFIESCKILE
ncbi:FRG domain-containing protein [Clostridium chromiireducens]|uniref:FRG domain-containing protein n=1 Tax=Clostridium chromiireducens TaxID=225345 RepID=UPI003AF51EC0